MSFFSNLWKKLKIVVTPFFEKSKVAIETFLSSAAENLLKNGGEFLVNTAKDAVAAAEAAGGSSQQKKDAAAAAVITAFKTKGLPYVISSINLAIEAAVAQQKELPTTNK